MNQDERADPLRSEERFDRIARLTQRTFGVEAVVIGFFDGDRLIFKSRIGIDETSVPRVATGDPLAAYEPHYRFRAFHVLLDDEGREIGLLGLLGRSTQTLDPEQRRALRDMAGMIQDQRAHAPDEATADNELARALERLRNSPPQAAARRRSRIVIIGVGLTLLLVTAYSSHLANRLVADTTAVERTLSEQPAQFEPTRAPLQRLHDTARFFRAAILVRSALAVLIITFSLILLGRYVDERLSAHALAELERSRFQAIINAIGDGVIVADARGRLTLFNPAAERILGVGVLDAEPGLWSRLYGIYLTDGSTLCPAERHPLSRAIAGDTARAAEFVVRNAHRPGGVRVTITATPVRAADGRPAGGVAIIRDALEPS